MWRALAGLGVAIACSSTARADSGDRWNASTIALQAGGAVLGGAVAGGALGAAGLGIGSAMAKGQNDWGTPLLGGVIGFVVGGTIGIVVGAKEVGDARDGTGSYLGTSLGMAGGIVLVSGWIKVAGREGLDLPGPILAAVGGLFLCGGPIVGYQLTADAHAEAPLAVPLVAGTF